MRLGLRAAFLAVAIVIPACGPFQGYLAAYPPTVANGLLRGSQVVPALGTGATGTAIISVDFQLKYFDYSIVQTGIATVTAVEIRLGVPGANGPVLFTLPLTSFPMSGRINDPGFFPMVGTINTFAGACQAISSGNTYLLISSAAQATGEIRAHLGVANLASVRLSGGQEVGPLAVTGTGNASVLLNGAQDGFSVTLNVSGVTGITAAQIFDGAPNSTGSAPLFSISSTAFTTSATATLASGDFTTSATITTFTDAINALLSGGLYIQVLTSGHPTGEIRGQVGPTQMNAVFTAADVVPPNTSTATGSATLALNATQDGFFITMTHTVAAADQVNLNVEVAGSNGPKIFDIDAHAGAATSPLSATVPGSDLIPNSGQNILLFPDAVNAILTGKTYVEVADQSFPGGEIRGQLLP